MRQWQAVISDWNSDGRIDGRYSCGAIVEALAHVDAVPLASPAETARMAVSALDRYAVSVCPKTTHPGEITVGMSDTDVANIAGMPRTPRLNCWLYATTRAQAGHRVCFEHGRVTLVRVSDHG